MKKLFFSSFTVSTLFVALGLSHSAKAQTVYHYFTGFDNAAQKAGWQQFRKGDLGLANWGYATFNAYSTPERLSHNYPVGGTVPTDDWFVSPGFYFSGGGIIDSLRFNFSGFGTPNTGDTLLLMLLEGSPDPDLATNKTVLKDYYINYVHDGIWKLDTNIGVDPTNGIGYLAFRYKTTVNWMDVMFDNISLSIIAGAGVNSIDKNNFQFFVYPNPSTNNISVSYLNNKSQPIEYSVMNCLGQIVFSSLENEQAGNINRVFNLENMPEGIYILKVKTPSEIMTKQIMISK